MKKTVVGVDVAKKTIKGRGIKMKVSNEVAREMLYHDRLEGSEGYPNFQTVEDEILDTTRWSVISTRVYKDLDTGRFWRTTYSTGATECQDERAYEYDGDEIEFEEVFPVEKVVIVYE